jgi:SAM-dependent methyltransferase
MNEPSQRLKDRIPDFAEATPRLDGPAAEARVAAALARWRFDSAAAAAAARQTLEAEFPDQELPDGYWHDAAAKAFRDFFVWGHNHDFGFGITRRGAMATRHVEIISEAIHLGLLPVDRLAQQQVLDVGCWSGGDVLALAGLGATVTAIEEHPIAAAAARRLCELVRCPAEISCDSLYRDRPEWRQRFDFVYCSGVIYHVTDPLLLLRICFAYLKPGGGVLLETKMLDQPGSESLCSYAGTLEKGWNWFSPNRQALGRWLVDSGFPLDSICLYRRANGRLLAGATKHTPAALPETAGFSRPGSWLEAVV